jgi:ubiquinone/menaquinone biosynthesis C-methylase UbiE
MNINELIDHLHSVDTVSNEDWLQSLTPRKIAELEFHNKDRDSESIKERNASDTYDKFYGNKKYYKATGKSVNYTKDWIQKYAKGKVFLDYACGNGSNAIAAAKAGAELSIGLDISDISVQNCRHLAENAGVTNNTYFFQADAENTKMPDNSVDAIICSGMLHHLDLSYAFHELRRILKPGGRVLAVEALDYNPAIKLYRMLTPAMRTDWEKAHILSLADVKFAKRYFELGEIKYWHVVSYVGGKFPILMPILELIDSILTRVPFVRLLAWIFTFELVKPQPK